jgi:hypothetical protein
VVADDNDRKAYLNRAKALAGGDTNLPFTKSLFGPP